MTTFALSVTFPDAQQARIVAALKKHWTTTGNDGAPVVPTNAQVQERLRLAMRDMVREIVTRVERHEAVTAAAASVTAPDVS